MLELPPLTPVEGAAVLGQSGAGWVPEASRQELVAAVDGHALAVSVLRVITWPGPTSAIVLHECWLHLGW
jgi:hypothetical protein